MFSFIKRLVVKLQIDPQLFLRDLRLTGLNDGFI